VGSFAATPHRRRLLADLYERLANDSRAIGLDWSSTREQALSAQVVRSPMRYLDGCHQVDVPRCAEGRIGLSASECRLSFLLGERDRRQHSRGRSSLSYKPVGARGLSATDLSALLGRNVRAEAIEVAKACSSEGD